MARKYRGKRVSRKVPSKRKVVKKALRTAANARIKAVVKSVLGKQVETKVLQTAGTLYARPYDTLMSTANFNTTCYCLSPQGATIGTWVGGGYPILANGIGQDQRIGDEVRIKAHYFNYLLLPQGYNATTNPVPAPQIVMLYFVVPKIRNVNGLDKDTILGTSAANFFENQTNADSGFTGTTIDLLRKIDKDNYRVVAVRRHKLGFSGFLNTSNAVSTYGNNDFKAYVQGRVKISGSIWKVDRNEYYEGRNMFVFMTSFRADGTAISSAQIPVVCNFNHAVYYTDI